MVEKGMIMFNLQGNEVNINEIRGGTLYTTIQRTTRVSYDNGRKFETQTFRDNKTFSINDIRNFAVFP